MGRGGACEGLQDEMLIGQSEINDDLWRLWDYIDLEKKHGEKGS